MSELFQNIVEEIWLNTSDYTGYSSEEKYLSATDMIKPVKSLLLGKLVEETQIDNKYKTNRRIGQAVHKSIVDDIKTKSNLIKFVKNQLKLGVISKEDIPKFGLHIPKRRQIEIDGYIISGEPDYIISGVLHDIKTLKVGAWENDRLSEEDYITQCSIYRLLYKDLVKSDYATIDYIFKDWSQGREGDKDYPESSFIYKDYKLMSLEDTVGYIKSYIKLVETYKANPNELPCSSEERKTTPSKFAYYKNPDGKRATKVFNSFIEAENHKSSKGKNEGEIVERKGFSSYCQYYCKAKSICIQNKLSF